MSNVTLDNATRQHLRRLVSDARRHQEQQRMMNRGVCACCQAQFEPNPKQRKRFCSERCRRKHGLQLTRSPR